MKKFLTMAATAALGLGLMSCGEEKDDAKKTDDNSSGSASGEKMETVSLKVEGMT